MQAIVKDSNGLGPSYETASPQTHYSARFYFNPNSIQIAAGQGVFIFAGETSQSAWVNYLYLQQAGQYYILYLCGKDETGGNFSCTSGAYISNAWQAVEMEWMTASSSTTHNGYLNLWVDNTLEGNVANLNNDAEPISIASMGIDDVPAGTTGTMYFDGFESWKGDRIGLDPNGPALQPPVSATVTPTFNTNCNIHSHFYIPTKSDEYGSTPTNTPTPVPGAISGTAFNDLDGSGTQDAGENGIYGVAVSLYDSAGVTFIAGTTTDGNGNYSFSGLTAGTYQLVETMPDGYASTTSSSVSAVAVTAGATTSVNFGVETFTPTPTNTPTDTPTFTPTASDTPTNTPTFIPTYTPTPSGPVTINYTYDALNRLTAANYSNGTTFTYAYDAAGNVLQYTQTTGATTVTTNYTYDSANQLMTAQLGSASAVHYAYDGDGNLLSNGVNTYAYDSADRLISVTNQQSNSDDCI